MSNMPSDKYIAIAEIIKIQNSCFFINLITTLNYYTAIDYFRLQNKSPTENYNLAYLCAVKQLNM